MSKILVQERLLRKIEKTLDLLLERDDLINEKEAAKYLGKSIKTIQNYVSSGKIPSSAYKLTVIGNRMYKKSKFLMDD